MNPFSESTTAPLQEHPLATYAPGRNALYSLEMVARLADVSRYRVALYCKHGLIVPVRDPAAEGWWFDATAIDTLRQVETFRSLFGVNYTGSRLILTLMRELEDLRREARFLREQ